MNIIEIITKKKNKEELTYEELYFAFNGYLTKDIPDYQMSALLMAMVINGLSLEETVGITDIFIKSGETYEFDKKVADKHSTGGVGDTTTLIICSILASLNIPVAKMSGAGLGITGGTIDKLAAIPGFKTALSREEFYDQVNNISIAITSQTDTLVPLDKLIYALRDVTGTTESVGLIASSIMSKKIASGASYIIVDIKHGNGALIKKITESECLSDWLIKIGERFNRKVRTMITPMDAPLGMAIGNALEVEEAIEVLKGKQGRLKVVSVELAAELIAIAKGIKVEDAIILAENALKKGGAYKMFEKWVTTQGGDLSQLKISDKILKLRSTNAGKITAISALNCGKLALKLGAGRQRKGEELDYGVGIKLLYNEGDYVQKDEVLAELYVNDETIDLTEEDLKLFVIEA